MQKSPEKQKLPLVGTDNYPELASGQYVCIDKTLFIPEFLSGDKVTLLTYPSCWNKTTNLTMTEAFLSNHPDNKGSAALFLDKKVAQVDKGSFLKTHQGQYPVIFLTMKDLSVDDELSFIDSLADKIAAIYKKHSYLLDSEKILDIDKIRIRQYQSGTIKESQLTSALLSLSTYLNQHWGKRVFILIDEYDSPVNELYNDYFHAEDYQTKKNLLNIVDSITEFLCNFFGAAMKTNPALEKGLMTGVLRVLENGMLSGFNNVVMYGSLEDQYAEFFGFTEEEVNAAFTAAGFAEDVIQTVRSWYNGYTIGAIVRYNPWSVMCCLGALIKKDSSPYQCYWVRTGFIDKIIKKILDSDEGIRSKISALIAGGNNEKLQRITLTENSVYEDLLGDSTEDQMNAFFTLLLHAGYLTASDVFRLYTSYCCDLSIPNRECYALFHHGLDQEKGFKQKDQESVLKRQKRDEGKRGSKVEKYVPEKMMLEEEEAREDEKEEPAKRRAKREDSALGKLSFLGARSRKQGRRDEDDNNQQPSASLGYASSENPN